MVDRGTLGCAARLARGRIVKRLKRGVASKFGYAVSQEVEDGVIAVANRTAEELEKRLKRHDSADMIMAGICDVLVSELVCGAVAEYMIREIGPKLRSQQDAVARVLPVLRSTRDFIASLQ